MTPADELKQAAARLRETAAQACRGLPLPWSIQPGFKDEWLVGSSTPHLVASAVNKSIADWFALMSPALAEPLAAWLEHVAETWPFCKRSQRDHALAVARALNGGAS